MNMQSFKDNCIENEGVGYLSEALESNTTLTQLDLDSEFITECYYFQG